jgi:hypothetical protein
MKCSSCGKQHPDDLPLDVAARRPLHYFMVPEAERATRIQESDDLCVIDGRELLVRGVLRVPIVGTSHFFGWGMWALIDQEKFELIDHQPARCSEAARSPPSSATASRSRAPTRSCGWRCRTCSTD